MRNLYRDEIESIDPDNDTFDFVGAKGIISIGGRFVVVRRDEEAPVAPGLLDLIGGRREPGETPRATFGREVEEEVGLKISNEALIIHAERFPMGFIDEYDSRWDTMDSEQYGVFMVAHFLGATAAPQLGNEGSELLLLSPTEYLS